MSRKNIPSTEECVNLQGKQIGKINDVSVDGNGNYTLTDVNDTTVVVNDIETIVKAFAQHGKHLNSLLSKLQGRAEQQLRRLSEKIQLLLDNQNLSAPKQLLTKPPQRTEVFEGRAEDLKELEKILFGKEKLLLLVSGQGGIGKTTLAARYFHNNRHKYKHLAWVLAEPSIKEGIIESLKDRLGVKFEKEDTEVRFRIIMRHLESLAEPVLFVLNNVNEERETELKVLSGEFSRYSNVHFLLTSRLNAFAKGKLFPVKPLEVEDAWRVFRQLYENCPETDRPLFEEIFTTVIQGNTLILRLFAKNLNVFDDGLEQEYSLKKLLSDLQGGLTKLSKSAEIDTNYKPVGTSLENQRPETIILAMYDLSNLAEIEKQLLSCFAVLPAEAIPYEDLKQLLPFPNLSKHLKALHKRGWLDFDTESKSFKTSPVIQGITLEKNSARLFEYCKQLIEALTNLLEVDDQRQEYYLNFKWIAYTQKLINLFFESQEPEIAVLNNNLALVLEELGGKINLEKAKGLLQKALKSDIRNFGVNSSIVSKRKSNLATIFLVLNGEKNLKQAYSLLESALKSDISNFGENSSEVARRRSNLAMVLQDLGGEDNLRQARDLMEEVLKSDISNFGENSPKVAVRRSNLALVLRDLGGKGNLEQAKFLLEKALASDVKNFGEKAPRVAKRQLNLATILRAFGGKENLLHAKVLLEKALASNIENLGKNSPIVTVSQSNLALVLQDLGGKENYIRQRHF